MKKLYQKTFEQALAQTYAPPEQVEAQRSALASRCSQPKSEVTAMTTKLRRPIRILITAAVVAAALTAGALAASGVLSRITFHTGATIEYGVNEDGTEYSTVSGTSLDESYPVEVRNDRAWFTTETGEELDITGQFSETEPYVYSYVDEGGLTHDIVVGGTLESFGLFEYLYDEGGGYTASTGYLPPESPAYPAWRAAYEAEHGIPAPSGGEPVEQDSSSGLIWLDPQLAVEDGKVLLTVGGETTDITGRFSESEAYVRTDEGVDGSTHVILVGGTATEPHTAEFVVEADGTWTCSTDAPEDSAWLTSYIEANLSR
ncbi:hypothetical protein [Flavonifractor sp.]|uniref:hypothetical protein n=1 Tax=Flavonifractor sp. TaxID=2049025 RepID=UPI0025C387D7|nr:hypothetical protein [Flavonifractor sp.]